MASESKIAAAITSVAIAIVVAFVVVPEIKERRAATALAEAFEQINAEARLESARHSQQAAENKRRRDQWSEVVAQAKRLKPDERCVSGYIVRTRVVDGVPTYEQLSRNGHPIKCLGHSRL